jgi:class 3 adenylate cyclase
MFIGFALIHPITMLMNHHMSGPSHHPEGVAATMTDVAWEAFATLKGVIWGSVYGAVSGLIGFLIGAVRTRELALRSANEDLAREKDRSDKLLLNVLPKRVADELKDSGRSDPQKFDNVTVLFSDIVGFSRIAADLPPEQLIGELNELVTGFDTIIEANRCERIKTIGDGYLAVCGMPREDEEHARRLVRAAVEMIEFLKDRNQTADFSWDVRIGIHTGEVVGGVVGVHKYIYDVFGDTINCAARLEQHSAPMRINISETTRKLIDPLFASIPRGSVETKGKGAIEMHYLV